MLPVLILAGGLGTRLGALTAHTPKSLVTVAGKPFIQWQIDELQRQGFYDITVCTGRLGEYFYGVVAKFLHDGDTLCVGEHRYQDLSLFSIHL